VTARLRSHVVQREAIVVTPYKEVEVPALPTLDDRDSSIDGRADLATIAQYLVQAVARDEITLAEAELAIVDWTHDPDLLRAAVTASGLDAGAARLLQRVAGRCRWAA